jgi:uridine phosphorylase
MAAAVPARLRPTAPIATDAVLVGDPGRALLLAQELLEQPRMSNHARGLWGYSGRTPAGSELTIQATGIGGPSAATVLADLAELGVRRAIRVGTCTAADPTAAAGDLLIVERAIAVGGSAAAFGLEVGEAVAADEGLTAGLRAALGSDRARLATVASFDLAPEAGVGPPVPCQAHDLQTVATLTRAKALEIAAAAVLVVTQTDSGEAISDEGREAAEKAAGEAASRVLSA